MPSVTQRSAMQPLIKAIRARLAAEVSVPVLVHIEKNTARPFVVVGDVRATGEPTGTSGGGTYSVEVWAHTEYRGSKAAGDLADEIIQAVTATDLDLAADGFIASRATAAIYSVEQEEPGRWVAIVEFELFIHEV